ncbi:transposase [Nocardia sp. NPDC051981]|uniref:transposase n=1 Tax=Nocardia sp. NPDC051981 TaxID=3155417 RepID=UPI003433E610
MAQKKSPKSRQFSPEFRETAAREVVEKSRAVADVARDCGADQTIRNWVRDFRRAHVTDSELSISGRARLKELERRVRELEEDSFLGKNLRAA